VGCSSCENWLSHYVEGELEPRRAAWMARHLESCPSCEQLHRRLRVVDALLETVRPIELHNEFSSSVMAAILELPIAAAPRRAWPFFLTGYLIAGWLVLAAAFVDFRSRAGVFTGIAHGFERLVAALGPVSHSISSVTPWAIAAVVLMLAIDVLLFALIAVYYRRVAPRLAVHLARVEVR
jgi:anti-sigma factor RsiW